MAYYQLEPFGDLVADMRHGVSAALLANINRPQETQPYKFDDFIHWRETSQRVEVEPVFLDDPVAQGNLMRAAIFGKAPK